MKSGHNEGYALIRMNAVVKKPLNMDGHTRLVDLDLFFFLLKVPQFVVSLYAEKTEKILDL